MATLQILHVIPILCPAVNIQEASTKEKREAALKAGIDRHAV